MTLMATAIQPPPSPISKIKMTKFQSTSIGLKELLLIFQELFGSTSIDSHKTMANGSIKMHTEANIKNTLIPLQSKIQTLMKEESKDNTISLYSSKETP